VIVVVAPEPAPWIAPTVRALAAFDLVELWAPWAMTAGWAALPGAAGRFAARRLLDGAGRPPVTQPGWALAQAGARWWAGAQVDRRYRLAFAERALVDGWAAHRLASLARAPSAVVGCTGAALRTFAVAARRGTRTALVGDLPWLRGLHADLDRAAAALPDRGFLRRFRAPREAIVRQEMERAQADLVAVRGHYAHALCVEAGLDQARLCALPTAPRVVAAAPPPPGARTLRFAGLATARAGLDATLAALAAHPELRLGLRTGDGTEPPDVLTRPNVVAIDGDPWPDTLAVVAPAWCEAYPPELDAAIARGVPVIATPAASGFAPTHRVAPGDADALAAAIASVRAGAIASVNDRLPPTLDAALRR